MIGYHATSIGPRAKELDSTVRCPGEQDSIRVVFDICKAYDLRVVDVVEGVLQKSVSGSELGHLELIDLRDKFLIL